MKTITVSTPNQECIGFELMRAGAAGKARNSEICSWKVVCAQQQRLLFLLTDREVKVYRSHRYQVSQGALTQPGRVRRKPHLAKTLLVNASFLRPPRI